MSVHNGLQPFRREWFLLFSMATMLAFLLYGEQLLYGFHSTPKLILIFGWLFGTILGSALAVVRHADRLAEHLGEPYGTLILTLSITTIEVISISEVMMHGDNNPTLARDTLFAVAMIILNGVIGLSLLIGGWRRLEQHHNLPGASAYLSVIIPLGVLALILPDFTISTVETTLNFPQEMFIAISSLALYVVFLFLQSSRHRGYFISLHDEAAAVEVDAVEAPMVESTSQPPALPLSRLAVMRHGVLLLVYMVPVVFLAEKLAMPVDFIIEGAGAPVALAGLAMAILVVTPEAVSAVGAARRNQLTRSINISMGSVLATIGLTIPAILVVSHVVDHPITLGLQNTDLLLFSLTLVLSVVTFSSGRTTVLQGAIHLLLFFAYLFFMFQP